ncbi:DNA repair protein rad26 [Colletotrichum sojae]|uniref:DNA repair protein rad26 n=1 Tax=Colletotrichum sojae TaxID=2175907 RepID=A0A8H6MTJ2_9PEZI|nr:DNA repair protein rad26 [Colletotrichum sojae]
MDDFSDDDFDELNDITLQELENNAIQLTQAQRKLDSSRPPNQSQIENYNDLEFEDDDLDYTEVTNELLPPVSRPVPEKPAAQHQAHLARRPSQPPQQRWNPPPATTNPPLLSSRPRYPPPPVPSLVPPQQPQRFLPSVGVPRHPQPTQLGRPPPPSSVRYNPTQSQAQTTTGPGNDIVGALQKRLKVLEAELIAAQGEAAIIRSNSTKAQQEHVAEIARLKKQNAEQAAKQERAVEAAIAAERNVTTELQFLQQDMKEATNRPRRRDAVQEAPVSGTSTPKKTTKSWGMADGFDDMDIVPSPTKTRGKARDGGPVAVPLSERTPTKGKRKRPVVDSPVMALETNEDVVMIDDAVVAAVPALQQVPGSNVLPFEFLQVILDHGSLHGEPPTFDILSRYAFPSDPTTSLAALIFKELPLMGNPLNPVQLLVDFARMVIRMWEQCMSEKFFRPIWDLTSLLSFTLQLQTMSVVPQILKELVPTAQGCVYAVAELRFRSIDGDISSDPAGEALDQHIDTTYILSLLYASAAACATAVTETENGPQTRQAEFWRLITVDLALVLLTPKQRLDDILIMLDMLCTSALSNSLGPIVPPGREPDRLIIDKVSLNLVDLPRAAVTTSEKQTVRFAALRTLMAFARTPYGARQIASHVSVIPRLVTALSELVDVLYDLSDPVADSTGGGSSPQRKDGAVDATPDDPRDRADNEHDGRRGPSQLISQIILLLHSLAMDPNTANIANIHSKLSISHGGPQRYMLSLSRLSFAEEDLVYESKIDADTVDRAHELLELGVTPDEGESIAESFGV